jgi:hypothetical protein
LIRNQTQSWVDAECGRKQEGKNERGWEAVCVRWNWYRTHVAGAVPDWEDEAILQLARGDQRAKKMNVETTRREVAE